MKHFVIALAAASTLGIAVPTVASAAPWQSINQRQAHIDRRIDMGVRNGALTRNEAVRLRGQLASLERLERQYRRHGLTYRERLDLDRRFDKLSRQVYIERNDRQTRGRHDQMSWRH